MVVTPAAGTEGGTGASPSPLRGLRWRIKDSFVGYVMGGAGGRYALGDGAQLLSERYFAFPAAAGGSGFPPSFSGRVAFRAHGGMLQVVVANPAIRESPDGFVLTVELGGEAVAIATLDGLGDGDSWVGAVPRLTAEGREMFGDVYDVGAPLDPLCAWRDEE